METELYLFKRVIVFLIYMHEHTVTQKCNQCLTEAVSRHSCETNKLTLITV